MNILVSAARNLSPIDDWCLLGTKKLVEYAYGAGVQWILFDKTLNLPTGLARERKLRHNTFHHQSLGPIQAVALTGTRGWSGPEMQSLYRTLARTEIPMWALGLELPKNSVPFTNDELACFARPGALISVTNEISQEWLRRFDLESALLSSPILFAYDSPGDRRQLARGPRPKVAWVIQDRKPPDLVPEKLIRQSIRQLQKLSSDYDVERICLTTDDFMRFGSIFRGQVRYSYESRDYLELFLEADIVVSSNFQVALAANSCEKPAVLIGPEKIAPDPKYPFIFPATPTSVNEQIGEALAVPIINSNIASWKDVRREEWIRFMAPNAIRQTKAA